MLDFTFLTKEQIFGDDKLKIFNKRGTVASITDFAILLGGYYDDGYYKGKKKLENSPGYYWTKTGEGDNTVYVINDEGDKTNNDINERDVACRPVLSYSLIKDFCKNKKTSNDGILEVEFGEYPQKVVSEELQNILNSELALGTGKTYTIDSKEYDDYDEEFEAEYLLEYEYQGKKYVRVEANCFYRTKYFNLSTGDKYKNGDLVWVEVLPVKWLVDKKKGIAVSEKLLFAGVQFMSASCYLGNFKNTDIKKYLDNYFSKEIIPSQILNKTTDIKSTNANNLQNAYKFDFKEVSEEELIRGSLESNIAPFLHGRSSEGKSARIKQFDPDAEIVYLRNATPDSLNGKSVYNAEKNEMIDVPPT